MQLMEALTKIFQSNNSRMKECIESIFINKILNLEKNRGGGENPIGTIIIYIGLIAPEDYLLCDGSVYSIKEYSFLAEFIKDQFGRENYFGGDGITTFAVPNICGRNIIGLNLNDNDFNNIGNVGGSKTHQLTIEEIPSHKHSYYYATGGSSAGHCMAYSSKCVISNSDFIKTTGGDQPHNNLPPYIVCNYCIKYTPTIKHGVYKDVLWIGDTITSGVLEPKLDLNKYDFLYIRYYLNGTNDELLIDIDGSEDYVRKVNYTYNQDYIIGEITINTTNKTFKIIQSGSSVKTWPVHITQISGYRFL